MMNHGTGSVLPYCGEVEAVVTVGFWHDQMKLSVGQNFSELQMLLK
jgi:hypothetical protein